MSVHGTEIAAWDDVSKAMLIRDGAAKHELYQSGAVQWGAALETVQLITGLHIADNMYAIVIPRKLLL